MGDETQNWGVYHYRRTKGRRLIATLIAKFDNAQDARQLMKDWKGEGPVYVSPCAKDVLITPAGKRKLSTHRKNSSAHKTAPELDKSWEYVTPAWNAMGV